MKIEEAKKIIYIFFKNRVSADHPQYFGLTDNASDKIFWSKVKQSMPQKPYIMLSEASVSKLYKRFETFHENGQDFVRKEMRLLVTFGVYTLNSDGNLVEADNLATELVEYIQDLFTETQNTFDTLSAQGITVNELVSSDIRDLSQFSQTNQEFRKEIDIAFEYEDIQTYTPELGQDLDMEISNK